MLSKAKVDDAVSLITNSTAAEVAASSWVGEYEEAVDFEYFDEAIVSVRCYALEKNLTCVRI